MILLSALWLLLPAMVANMMPIWAKYIHWLDYFDTPIDRGKLVRGKPLFGRNKTYRGLLSGLVIAVVVGLAQGLLAHSFTWFRALEFNANPMNLSSYVLLAVLLGLGALLGDIFESMIKRQLNVAPGAQFFPFDQLDYVFGALILAWPLLELDTLQVSVCIAVGFMVHPIATFIGYKIGVKDTPL